MWNTLDNHKFPVAHSHCNLVCFGKFPIEIWVVLLCILMAKECWSDRDAIKIIVF